MKIAITGGLGFVGGSLAKRLAAAGHEIFVFHYALGWVLERLMPVPLVALAQVRILSEGIVEPLPACPFVPADLAPKRKFTEEQIRRGLPKAGLFGMSDFRCCIAVKTIL